MNDESIAIFSVLVIGLICLGWGYAMGLQHERRRIRTRSPPVVVRRDNDADLWALREGRLRKCKKCE